MANGAGVVVRDHSAQVAALVERRFAILSREAAQRIADRARSLAPVDTGQLRDSIEAEGTGSATVWRVVARAPHAIYQEYGTVNQPGTPFLTPALESERANALALLASAVGRRFSGR